MPDLTWVISSCALILVVVSLRAAFGKKIHLAARYVLWGIVLLRLLVPVQLFSAPWGIEAALPERMTERDIYVLPVGRTEYPASSITSDGPDGAAFMGAMFDDHTRLTDKSDETWTFTRYAARWSVEDVLRHVWYAGIAVTAAIFLVTNLRFYLRLRKRRILMETDCKLKVYSVEKLSSSCLFLNAVYIPVETAGDAEKLRHILAHETAHWRHGDGIWALLRCAALALHWYNPLVWLTAVLFRRDSELFADEGALKTLGESERENYGVTLIRLSAKQPLSTPLLSTATTMAGGKKALKERIVMIAKRPKAAVWAVVVVCAAAVLAVGVTLAGAAEPEPAPRDGTEAVSAVPAVRVETGIIDWVPRAALDWAVEIVQADAADLNAAGAENLSGEYRITDARITRLDIPQWNVTVERGGEAWTLELFTLEYRLLPDHLENVVIAGGMRIDDGWLTQHNSMGSPRLLLAHTADGGDRQRVRVLMDGEIGGEQASREMLEAEMRKYFNEWYETRVNAVPGRDVVAPVTVVARADLDRDGDNEEIAVTELSGGWAVITVTRNDGTELWREELNTAHVGWGSYFLHRSGDGRDSLLYYSPYMSTGVGGYSYELFSLTGGTKTVVQSGTLEFILGPAETLDLDGDAMTAFADEINALLARSTLIASTEGGTLNIGPASAAPYYEDYSGILDDGTFTYPENLTLAEKIRYYEERLRARSAGTDYINDIPAFLGAVENRGFHWQTAIREDPDAALELLFNLHDYVLSHELTNGQLRALLQNTDGLDGAYAEGYQDMLQILFARDAESYLYYWTNLDSDAQIRALPEVALSSVGYAGSEAARQWMYDRAAEYNRAQTTPAPQLPPETTPEITAPEPPVEEPTPEAQVPDEERALNLAQSRSRGMMLGLDTEEGPGVEETHASMRWSIDEAETTAARVSYGKERVYAIRFEFPITYLPEGVQPNRTAVKLLIVGPAEEGEDFAVYDVISLPTVLDEGDAE